MRTSFFNLALAVAISLSHSAFAQTNAPETAPKFPWGRIIPIVDGSGTILLQVNFWPENNKLILPAPFPNITSVEIRRGTHLTPLFWTINSKDSTLEIELPGKKQISLTTIVLETAEKTTQFADGRITFSALDAEVKGNKAKLETDPGNHRIGFWTDQSDSVSWNYKPTRWGMYDVELTYSAEGDEAADLQIEVGDHVFKVSRPSTGNWYHYAAVPVGRFYLTNTQPYTVKVSCTSMKGSAVANLKSVTLRPAPEGAPVVEQASGLFYLHASNAITHSVTMRYEPLPEKNCLGWWVNAKDWAEWRFKVTKTGDYNVEILMGCGKGQGGSDIHLETAGQMLSFQVVDTGDYHHHAYQRPGKISFTSRGDYSLAIKPYRKKAGAIMDIESISLVPLEK